MVESLADFLAIGTLSPIYKEFVIEKARELNAKYIMIVCDRFDYEDYPVYITDENYQSKIIEYNNQSMQKVMGVYSLD